MKSKLRLDYFLMRGGELAVGDYYSCSEGEFTYWKGYDCDVSANKGEVENCLIKAFESRFNEGSKPVPDDFPIIAGLCCESVSVQDAGLCSWVRCRGDNEIISWKPNIAKLLEQQNEFDKKENR